MVDICQDFVVLRLCCGEHRSERVKTPLHQEDTQIYGQSYLPSLTT